MAKPRLVLLVCVLLLSIQSMAFAGGLSFEHNGAAAMGKGNAFAGEANDPSAIFYNPAGITQLPGTQVMIGTAITYLDSTFRSSTTGESTQLQDQFPIVPHFYITHRFQKWDERLSIGLGVYTPFGLVVDWPDNWQGRFDSINAKFRATIINPTIAYRMTPDLSVAAGFRYANTAAEFQQMFNAGNGESKARLFDATANPIGWNVGLLYCLHNCPNKDTTAKDRSTSVGLQFRSELQAKLNGSAEFSGPASALFSNTSVHSNFTMPPQLVVGLSTKAVPNWTFNADVEWEGWSTVGTIPIHFTTTSSSPLNQQLLDKAGCTNQQTAPQAGCRLWKNSYVFRIGAEYAATDRLALRGGYFYSQSPIPDNTFDPTIPESNLHALTTGLGYARPATAFFPAVTFDLAYALGFYEKRSIDNSTINPDNLAGPTTFGSYSTIAHVLAASFTVKF
jgi:long-chain fatty acid transport protein